MRQFLIFISFLLLSAQLFAQKTKKKQGESLQEDTAYILVPLNGRHFSKTLMIQVGGKAKIYLAGDTIINEATKYLSNVLVKNEYSRIITFLDSSFSHSDTVSLQFYSLDFFQLSNLEYLVSQQLQNGYAKVFYNRQNRFVDTISHRSERYGGHGDRFFYLPDKRAFFGIIEITGIIDNEAFLSGKYYQAYMEEGKKLVRLGLE